MRTIEALKNGMIMGAGFISIVSVAYAAISWPSTPSGEVDGGKYSAKLVPSTAVMAFNASTCPTGWTIADGNGGRPDLRGEFIRGLDSGRGIDSGRTLASAQIDALKSHAHSYSAPGGGTLDPGGYDSGYALGAFGAVTSTFGGTETRPRNVALLYCVKD